MTKTALLTAEPIRERMAGIGIRYLELARRLPALGVETVLLTTGAVEDVPRDGLGGVEVRAFEHGRLSELLDDCGAIVAQGQVANDVVLEVPELPTVVDLYDPFLVENLHYLDTLGLDPYRNDHATWVLQLSRGDFFLCSCEEQREYYLGFLTALGRVNPHRVRDAPDLQDLVATVPFGVPEELPPHRPLLGDRRPGERRILFGGLYDWYDPFPLLEALLAESRDATGDEFWTVLFVRNPNPGGTPQRRLREVEAWTTRHGLTERVTFLDWIPADRRWDLLRDVDVQVATHRPSLETRLSLRTRFLDALAAGCPVVTTEGGAIARLLERHDAGRVVPPGDAGAVRRAIRRTLEEPDAQRAGVDALVRSFRWETVLEPLLGFCREPRTDPTKESFVFRPETTAPPDGLGFRVRRRLRRELGRLRRRDTG